MGEREFLPWEEYRKIRKMNPSTLAMGLKSMRHLKHAIDNGFSEPTDAMRVGTGVHALLLEPEEFDDRFVVMPEFELDKENVTGDGKQSTSKSTSYYKARKAEFAKENDGKEVLSRVQFEQCRTAIKAIREHHYAPKILEGAETEVTVRGVIEGVECKGRVDAIGKHYLIDVKTAADAGAISFGLAFARMGYGFKMAMYREMLKQQTGKVYPVAIIAQEVKGVFDTVVHEVPEAKLDAAFDQVIAVMREYKRCLESGKWPGVDKGEDCIQLYVPNWDMPDDIVVFEEGNYL